MGQNISLFLKLLVLTMVQVLGDDKAILASATDDMEYIDNKPTGKRLGSKYTVVCPKLQYMSVTVKVPDTAPVVTQEALDSAETPVWVTFEEFRGRLYAIRDEVGLTCRADKIIVVSPAPAKAKERGAGV